MVTETAKGTDNASREEKVPAAAGDFVIYDGCTAAAHVAYANSDAAFIFPITPSTVMAETADLWRHQGRKNIFGQVCEVRQMQSEGGAAGAVHGSLMVGSLTTTFTASQGLLLMIPNMYKIAGELTSCVFHVSARAIAGQALSIFGDHSDVMAVRQCGWALLSSTNVQDAMDLGQIAHMATLKASVPFVHFFDGFRTSHELQKIRCLSNDTIAQLLDHEGIANHRRRCLTSAHPKLVGTAQGPEVYFQNVEAVNKYYDACPNIVAECMKEFAQLVGREYHLFEYHGHPEATDVLVIMGAGSPVIGEAIDYLLTSTTTAEEQRKVGCITVRLFRPWKLDAFLKALPKTVKRVSVLDRVKESGAFAEPLYLDVAASLQAANITAIMTGGRYGLGSKDFTPSMVFAILDNMRSPSPKLRYTVGIEDDVTHLSLDAKPFASINTVPKSITECLFWGMGSDGTVGANKNVIKIIGDNTPLYVQGYFAYSAHKAGGLTISHLRFGPEKITSQYLVKNANYVACHRDQYVYKYNMVDACREGGVFVLNCPWTDAELDFKLPGHVRRAIANKNLQLYTIDANKVAVEAKMGRRVNNILMTVFFKLSGVLPFEEAVALFKKVIKKTYEKKGMHVVEANWVAVDMAVDAVHCVEYNTAQWKAAPDSTAVEKRRLENAPEFVHSVLLPLERMEGDDLPVSVFSKTAGGMLPLGTAAWEKRGIALNVPIVDMDKCTQCNYCSFVCPHAAIRPFLLDDDEAERAPETFDSRKSKGAPELAGYRFRIQVSPMDCTGCELCAIACPDDCLTMTPLPKAEESQTKNWDFGVSLPRRDELMQESRMSIKGSQFYQPLMEFSGACEGCGETPYVKLLTQMFGERMIIANATGCSSIWGASYPSVPYTTNDKGMGPAWGNSLFEDNAEYGYGMIIALQHRRERFHSMVKAFLAATRDQNVSNELYDLFTEWVDKYNTDPNFCTEAYLKGDKLLEQAVTCSPDNAFIKQLHLERSLLIRPSHWIIGGDGWAYDIGYGGLDHVIASGANVNILVLDTEVYSNTGGQVSKATPMGAVHKFGAGGVLRPKKDMGAIAMEYGQVYVASVASSANMAQTVRAFAEAEAYNGPSLILAYAPCIEHGYIKPFSAQQVHCKMAVESGYWPLYRFNPMNRLKNEPCLMLDSKKIKVDVREMLHKENRFEQLSRMNPSLAKEALEEVSRWVERRFEALKARAAGTAMVAPGTEVAGDSISILYGSETGNAEGVANRIAAMMKERGLSANVSALGDVELDEVANMKQVVIVCATCGQGAFPENAKSFWEALEKAEAGALTGVTYAVFGLGDSSYVFFNTAAKNLDDRFAALGAKRLCDTGIGDDQQEDKYESALAEWLPTYWAASKAPVAKVSDEPPLPLFEVAVSTGTIPYKQCVPHGAKMVKLCEVKRLTPEDYEVEVKQYTFDLSGSGIKYGLGDSLAIFPQSPKAAVEEMANLLKLDLDAVVRVKRAAGSSGSAKHEALLKSAVTVRQLLTEVLDVCGKPSPAFFANLPRYCTDETERAAARALQNDKEAMRDLTNVRKVNCLDMMKRFPSCCGVLSSLAYLLDMVPLHKPRYYSIASSQKFVGENRLELCIGTVDWKIPSGETRFGGCTGYLRTLNPVGTEGITVAACVKATAFHLPPSDMHPMIVAGMGTGLAPFRAFIQYRAWLKRQGKPTGPVTVYFGCRYSKKDFLFGDELQAYEKEGVITELRVAFSRDQAEKFYVQHHIDRDPALLYKRLVLEKGCFYLCGSAKQVPIDIFNSVTRAIAQQAPMSLEDAAKLVTDMRIKGQYNLEAW